MTETERKFLVLNSTYKTIAHSSNRIKQGYLNTDPKRTVRVRIKGEKAYITVKGSSNASGTTRFEWEKEIPVAEAEALFNLCEPGAINKIRYEVKAGSHTYEVDEFFGDNSGLVVAEIELRDENEDFIKPEWLSNEVTGDERYYNAYLSHNPYNTWK